MKVILRILLKIGCHGNILWGIGKRFRLIIYEKYLEFDEKIMKIGPVHPETIGLQETFKKKKIMEGIIYSPVGKFA